MKHELSDIEASHVLAAIQLTLELHSDLTPHDIEVFENIKVRLAAGLHGKLKPETLRRLELL